MELSLWVVLSVPITLEEQASLAHRPLKFQCQRIKFHRRILMLPGFFVDSL